MNFTELRLTQRERVRGVRIELLQPPLAIQRQGIEDQVPGLLLLLRLPAERREPAELRGRGFG